MASCSLGASNIKVQILNFNKARVGNLQRSNDVRIVMRQQPMEYVGLTVSRRPLKTFQAHCGPSLETEPNVVVKASQEIKPSRSTSRLIPNSSEVESLLTKVCDSTSISEFELKLGGFQLRVKRDIKDKSPPPPPPVPAPTVSTTAIAEAPSSNGSASTSSLAITKPVYSYSGGIQTLLDNAADDGLVIIKSPRVGFFRRSRTIKGKRAPPSCKEKQVVKEGQVLCYIEQLGGEIPIESDVSGEVVKILRKDNEPVGYNDAIIVILPSFPGIKKLLQ